MEHCCATLPVPTTTFWLGVRAEDPDGKACMQHGGSNYCDKNEEPASQATVRAFRLDRFEVTVGRFRKFVEAGTLQPAAGSGKHGYLNGGTEPGWVSLISFPKDRADWDRWLLICTYATWTVEPGASENKPINCVPWELAYAFCIWDGGYLPTEAEWELAASGGDERVYPWGQNSGRGCGPHCSDPQLVGSYSPSGDGAFGHADMAGNAFEWVLDSYAPYPARCDDCANLSATGGLVRGGAGTSSDSELCAAYRGQTFGGTGVSGPYGIRCARPAE
jgi:formylglycine-generating enzyme required for sulfatase activity